MYKQIYKKIKLLLILPKKFWEQEAEESDITKYDVMSQFVYPLLGLIAVSAFIGYWLNSEIFDLPGALQLTCISFFAGFAGFFVASFTIDELAPNLFEIEKDITRTRTFVGYASVVLYLVTIFMSLFPGLFFVFLFLFYTVYIIWEGADVFMQIETNNRQKFTIVSSVLIIGAPMLIHKILVSFLPGVA